MIDSHIFGFVFALQYWLRAEKACANKKYADKIHSKLNGAVIASRAYLGDLTAALNTM